MQCPNNEVTEIRWHARGGQGAVTASKTLVEMILPKNMYFQSFPEFGPERMGAPIQVFNRISSSPITVYCGITTPDIVLVLDVTLLDVVDVTSGLKKNGIIIVNTNLNPDMLSRIYGLQDYRPYTVDATRIALDTMGKPFANIPMLGAFLKITGLLEKEEAIENLRSSFSKRYPSRIVDMNVKALEHAYKEVKLHEKVGSKRY
ncbi:MAG: pyruvate synthase [Firmicutes bacterium]|nr:pyruvate synthase [Bacillota bacterium]